MSAIVCKCRQLSALPVLSANVGKCQKCQQMSEMSANVGKCRLLSANVGVLSGEGPLRGIKKGFLDKEKDQEGGESYSSGNYM